jgi:hypothetical protein
MAPRGEAARVNRNTTPRVGQRGREKRTGGELDERNRECQMRSGGAGRGAGESAEKSRAPGEGCAARKFRRKADYFLASMAPAPPHFSQFLLSLAEVTQHA